MDLWFTVYWKNLFNLKMKYMRSMRVNISNGGIYRVAFFVVVDILLLEELMWDYGCSFQKPKTNVVFHCKCGSALFRDIIRDEPAIFVVDLFSCNDSLL